MIAKGDPSGCVRLSQMTLAGICQDRLVTFLANVTYAIFALAYSVR